MGSANSPQWISHRGYCKHEIENTLGAFDEAVNLGFDRLETDLRVSKDNQIVLSHDENLSRTGGPNQNINSLTANQLRELHLKYYKKIVFLDEFVNRYCAKNWIFDIKPEHGTKTIQALKGWAEYNQAHKTLTSQSWFLVWDRSHEKMIREFLPHATILADHKRCWRAGLSIYFGLSFLGGFIKGMIYALPAKTWKKDFFKKSTVKKIHGHKAKALAYLPKDEKETNNAIKAGFDYILTDHPPIRPRRVFSRPSFSENRRGPDNRRGHDNRRNSDSRRPGNYKPSHNSERSGPRSNDRSYNNKRSFDNSKRDNRKFPPKK